jgi:hypothetical protein
MSNTYLLTELDLDGVNRLLDLTSAIKSINGGTNMYIDSSVIKRHRLTDSQFTSGLSLSQQFNMYLHFADYIKYKNFTCYFEDRCRYYRSTIQELYERYVKIHHEWRFYEIHRGYKWLNRRAGNFVLAVCKTHMSIVGNNAGTLSLYNSILTNIQQELDRCFNYKNLAKTEMEIFIPNKDLLNIVTEYCSDPIKRL